MTEQALFLALLEIADPVERSAYLEEACAGDARLRSQVEHLLHAHEAAGDFMARCAAELVAAEGEEGAISEGPGTSIGPYQLLEQIGEGGFGVVFLAEQQRPVRRLVALKVLKPGMDTRQVVARFEAERQALAMMDHVNIARVFDGGTTESGRPYFVMEMVHGVPITRYCDDNRLTPRERLELFVPVCQAIQHAHTKGIIHRDVKPSNVMIALNDGKPLPKVIDFGVAKATEQKLTERTLSTQFGTMVGTLEYMSPEQAETSALGVDTRSDIYSLGVLLYELLTGSTPLSHERVKEAAYTEILRRIKEEDPPRPSRLRIADCRLRIPERKGRFWFFNTQYAIRNAQWQELDWIVMKALEKDRNRRYESASAFAADVQHYLNDEPVQACPPSAWYRFRKFARRNRTALMVAGLVVFFIALLGGGVGWTVRDRAARQTMTASDLETALDRADQFLEDGKWAEALATLDRAELLARQAPPDPARDARLAALKEQLAAQARDQEFLARFEDIRLQVQSRVHLEQSRFTTEASFPEIRDALGKYGIEVGIMTPAQAAARVEGRPEAVRRDLIAALGECLRLVPAGEAQTRQWLLATLAAADKDAWRERVRKAKAARDWETLEQQARQADVSRQPLGFLLLVAHSLPAPMRSTRLELFRRIQRAYPEDLWANHGLADELLETGKPAEAIRYYTAALALRPRNAGIYLNRGVAARKARELDAAIADFRQAVALAPRYATAHCNLGAVLVARGQWDEAIAACREALRIRKDDPIAHTNLGSALRAKGKLDEAIAAYKKAIVLEPDYAPAHYNLGNALVATGQWDEAIAAYREAIRIKKDYPSAHTNLGKALRAKGQWDEAIAAYRQAVALKPDHALAHYNLGNVLRAKGQWDEAIAAYRQTIRLNKEFAEAHCNLGQLLLRQGQVGQGLLALRRGHQLGSRDPGWTYPSGKWVRACERLVELETKLPDFLEGKASPASPAEQIELAQLCSLKRLHPAAARFYEEAFSAQPRLADDLKAAHRYEAARAAALAAGGRGNDAGKLTPQERARLRRHTLDWLRADLKAWGRLLDREPDGSTAAATKVLQQWLGNADFAEVRAPEALARLPEAERQPWQKLWKDVAETLARARTTPQTKTEAK